MLVANAMLRERWSERWLTMPPASVSSKRCLCKGSQAAAAHWGGSVLLTCAIYFGQPFARVDVIMSNGHSYGGQPLT